MSLLCSRLSAAQPHSAAASLHWWWIVVLILTFFSALPGLRRTHYSYLWVALCQRLRPQNSYHCLLTEQRAVAVTCTYPSSSAALGFFLIQVQFPKGNIPLTCCQFWLPFCLFPFCFYLWPDSESCRPFCSPSLILHILCNSFSDVALLQEFCNCSLDSRNMVCPPVTIRAFRKQSELQWDNMVLLTPLHHLYDVLVPHPTKSCFSKLGVQIPIFIRQTFQGGLEKSLLSGCAKDRMTGKLLNCLKSISKQA